MAYLKDLAGNLIGNFYGSGKLVIGANSLINDFTYLWIPRKHDHLTFNSLTEFLNFLLKHNLALTIQGSVEFNPAQKEWFCPTKLNQRWKARNKLRAFSERKKRNFAKAKLEKAQKLTKCLDCSRKIKSINLINHLTKIHQRKSHSKKRFRPCSQCQTNYSTLIKIREHRQFYCSKKANQNKTRLFN